MNNIKLKPCPFCGGVAEFRMRFAIASRGMSQVKAVCMNCDAESPHGPISMDGFKCYEDYLEAAKVAVERWNRRSE